MVEPGGDVSQLKQETFALASFIEALMMGFLSWAHGTSGGW